MSDVTAAPSDRARFNAEPSDADVIAAAHRADVERLERIIDRMGNNAATTAERMHAMETALEKIARAVATPPAPAPAPAMFGGLDQVLTVAKMLREVAAPAPQTTMQDAIAMMMSVLELREKIAAGVSAPANDGTGLGALLPSLIGPLTDALARQPVAPAPTPAPAPAPVRAALPAPAPHAPTMNPTPITALLEALPVWARMAISHHATVNSDPAPLVDHVLAMVPDDALDALVSAIANTETAVEEIVMRIPSWVPYKAWLRKLLDAIYARLVEEIEDTDAPANADAPKPIDPKGE